MRRVKDFDLSFSLRDVYFCCGCANFLTEVIKLQKNFY